MNCLKSKLVWISDIHCIQLRQNILSKNLTLRSSVFGTMLDHFPKMVRFLYIGHPVFRPLSKICTFGNRRVPRCPKTGQVWISDTRCIIKESKKFLSFQEREAVQALAVLEACAKSCGPTFQAEMAKFKFLNEMIKLVRGHS